MLGFVEAQRPYWLDDRFIVRSLDGRVDDILLTHIHDDHIDYAGYIKERHVGYLASLPGDIGTPAAWGLDRLAGLQPGESAEHDGLRFTRLASGWVRVRPIGPAPSPFTPAP